MNRTKLYVSAALFLFITIFKLSMPTAATDLRDKVLPAISHNTDYTQTLNVLGQRFAPVEENASSSEVIVELTIVREPEIVSPAEHIKVNYPTVYDDFVLSSDVNDSPEPLNTVDTSEPEIPEFVSAFLETQLPYSGYGIPETVSYDFTELPFSYTTPVVGMASSGFGYRLHPIFGAVKFHYGTDFSAWTGTPIHAFADGFVKAAGNSDSYGLYLIIDHGNGWSTLYAHCSQLDVTEGSSVVMGQQIALAGDTGQVTGPHLHFELMCGNIYYNPEYYING